MSDKNEPFAVDILPKAQVEKELSGESAEILKALERNTPKLSNDDIAQIVQRAAPEAIETWLKSLPPQEQVTWKPRLEKLAYDIGIGLASSAIWAALVYVLSYTIGAEGPERTEKQVRAAQRGWMIREALTKGLTQEELVMVDFNTGVVNSNLADSDRLAERVLQTDTFQQFLRASGRGNDREGLFIARWIYQEITYSMVEAVHERIIARDD
jgi:hypothetical protein